MNSQPPFHPLTTIPSPPKSMRNNKNCISVMINAKQVMISYNKWYMYCMNSNKDSCAKISDGCNYGKEHCLLEKMSFV